MSESSPITVQVVQTFAAPAEHVFDSWLDPQRIGRWMFGPDVREETVLHLEVDPQVGGAFSYLVRRGEHEIDHVGTFLEIDRPRRLVFTWGIAGESVDESRVIVELQPLDQGCELSLTHALDPRWSDYRDRVAQSWSTMLSALARTVDHTA